MRSITIVAVDAGAGESALSDRQDIVIVARATRIEDAIAAAVELNPRILLCGHGFAVSTQYALFDAVREKCPSTLSVLWSETDIDESDVITALVKGAVGLVKRSDGGDRLAYAIRRIDGGEAWVSRKTLGAIRAQLTP